MENIGDILRDTSDGKITDEQYRQLKSFFADKSREERIQIISKMKRKDLVHAFIIDLRDMLECYANISKNTFQSLADEIYEILLKIQDEDLILKYLEYLQFDYMVKELLYFVHDDNKKIKYIKQNELDWNNSTFLVACSLENDLEKVRCCEIFRDVRKKITLIMTIKDEKLRAATAMKVLPHFRLQIFQTIENQDILLELYFKNLEHKFVYKLLCLIHNDELKIKELDKYSIYEQIDIINSFDQDENLHKIIWDKKYDEYCGSFAERLKDERFILKYFDKLSSLKNKMKFIKGIKEPGIKRQLILLVDNVEYQNILLGNLNEDKSVVLKDTVKPKVLYDIDPAITIGVELEACCDCPEVYLNLKNILCNWDVKIDRTVTEGIEITSPILTFCEQDLTELKFICDFLNKNHFYTNEKCGGHIHLGFAYFESSEEFKIFLSLYKNVENIIYLISNRCFSEIRDGVESYAKRLAPILKQISTVNVNWSEVMDLSECISIIKGYCDSRYYGLNVWNALTDKNTIEFRMPNGEINFEEIILNIRLFAKMFEVSKQIATIMHKESVSGYEKEQLIIYNQILDEERNNQEKLLDLLTLLFSEDERSMYIERYTSNRKVHKSKQKQLVL